MCASGSKQHRTRVKRFTDGLLRRLSALLLGCACASGYAAQLEEHQVEDLDYGRSLYYFFQEDELAAITHLMVAKERPRTRDQIDEADLLLADLYYGYGLYIESRELFARLLNAEVSDSIQNRIWFNLARLRYEQGYPKPARDLLSRISGELPGSIEEEKKYLLTNLHLGINDYEEAADLSNQISSRSIWKVYARYNLGVSLIEDGQYKKGKFLLEDIGQMESPTIELQALRDRANLSLGLKQLRMELPEPAIESLSRIRLEGPLSNQALLASGWAWYHLNEFEKARLPWRVLLQRNAVDAATQEAILAIPANYAQSGKEKLAVRYYEVAANQFDLQLEVLDNAIASIENDGLVASLREHAILFDRSSLQRLPPSSDVTPQLHLLLASTEFQREIKRYQELLDIRTSLRYWGTSFPALELMLEERREGFEQKLPLLQKSTSFDRLDELNIRRNEFANRVHDIEVSENYEALANPDERDHLERLQRVTTTIDKVAPHRNTASQQDMLRLLSGLLHYEMATDFPVRFWKAKKQLLLLDRGLAVSRERVQSLRNITDRTELEYKQFQGRISGQSDRIRGMRVKVSSLLTLQEEHINKMAIDAIRQQQQHIVQLRLNARFELARIYDKMAAEQ